MPSFDRTDLVSGMTAIATQMEACQEELNHADGLLGDGDLGVTMARGMASVRKELPILSEDMGMALFAIAKCFTRISGSSYGTLLATGLMAAAKKCKGSTTIECTNVANLLEAALEAMQSRGKANLGDKTVLDTLTALQAGLTGVNDRTELAHEARQATQQALDDYRGKQSKQGRARMYGDKSKGLDDPGMLVIKRMVDCL